MNIGIDVRLLERKITGIGRSLIMLLEELPKIDKKNKYFLFSYTPVKIDNNFYTNVSTTRSLVPQKLFSPIWNNFIFPFYLKKNNINILFSVNQILPLVKIKGCRYISMVHDVIYHADPVFLPYIYRKYLQIFAHFSVRISDAIVTVSEYSKKDILSNYEIDERKIKVILQSASKNFTPMGLTESEKNKIKKRHGLNKHIVLYVGMIENRKNITGIIKVADALYEKDVDVQFALVGKIGYGGAKILEEVKKRKNVLHLSNVDDKLLKELYNIADVFLFPSYYEGFGYPPLEAMQCGLPVIAADNTSLREIVGTGGILHDADDYHSMTQDIMKIIEDENYSRDIREKGIERAKNFDIEYTTEKLVNLFNSFER